MRKLQSHLLAAMLLCSVLLPSLVLAECECESDPEQRNKSKAMRLKIAAIFSILAAGAFGVLLPIIGKSIPALSPERNVFFVIKAFAAGVILSTGMIHVLPDAFENLTSPCLKENPWGKFPFAGFVAMLSAIGTLMVDAFATGYYTRSNSGEVKNVSNGNGGGAADEEGGMQQAAHAHLHTHGSFGSAHNSIPSDLIRHRVVSQVSFLDFAWAMVIEFAKNYYVL